MKHIFRLPNLGNSVYPFLLLNPFSAHKSNKMVLIFESGAPLTLLEDVFLLNNLNYSWPVLILEFEVNIAVYFQV